MIQTDHAISVDHNYYAVRNKLTISDQITVPLTTESAFMYPTVMTHLFDRIRVTKQTFIFFVNVFLNPIHKL